uniref:Uncharacterized protein n=1 Tax=Pseudo-nitzschia australis TaxID=44445 RepID=A0A7S4AY04_9STRA|mmetsp:Transcript_2635/g.5709  ORF Transcript_2635/g.5709 Transcript_2635/m.5709 type:complete len:182 (+) Transcript_2635:155-700(+)|eukprot:CAMPEP_0168196980 /NCGR_PEP_ID=MMETSP0139_2-20121125/20873_1 /TAXON_ID=44445 /ORGANISM="Pseudo-nitzschia australis, Strain 10249 10 AB" /LENGTH=181 /DNA_ID=CAMNT_0008121327 /DNA_START=85 /DNA_END=630 /DNA_ORIENTATION=+
MFHKQIVFAAVLVALSTTLVVEGWTTTNKNNGNGRRDFMKSVVAIGGSVAAFGISSPAMAEQAPETRQGNEVTAFNGLAFNYKGGEFGGLDASTLDEPSVSYKDFNEKLKAGEVAFVEFLAPDGDVAYVTFKDEDKKIRIGEGYPIEQHDGYSSPMFCIRTVKNAGIPYKFIVKGLDKYSQ